MALQPVSPAPDSPVAKEPQAGEDKGADAGEGIFSLLFLLSLMGKNEGQNPACNVLQEEDAGMRPANPVETSMSPGLTKDDENTLPVDWGSGGRERAGMGFSGGTHPLLNPLPEGEEIGTGVFSSEKLGEIMSKSRALSASVTDLSQMAAADPNPSVPQTSPHAGNTKGDVTVGLFTDQGKIAIPGLHGSENQTSPASSASPAFGDSGIVPVFLKESDYQNNSGMSSDPQGEYPWMGDANGISVTKDPVSLSANSKLQPFPMHMDQENIMQQLSARMVRVREAGTHSARIRLKPDELGELSMDISVTNNSVKAFIIVENYHVKEIIEANLNRLETELKNQGLSMEQFTVETGGRGFKENYDLSHDRGDSAVRRRSGRTAMDHSADQEHLMIHDPMGRGIVNLFV